MIGVDITLSSTALRNEDVADVPFLAEMELRASSIVVIKEWLSAFGDSGWLHEANEKVLGTMMSWKNDGTGSRH